MLARASGQSGAHSYRSRVCKEELGTFDRQAWVHKDQKMLMKKVQELRRRLGSIAEAYYGQDSHRSNPNPLLALVKWRTAQAGLGCCRVLAFYSGQNSHHSNLNPPNPLLALAEWRTARWVAVAHLPSMAKIPTIRTRTLSIPPALGEGSGPNGGNLG